jgi:hypothetical protein
VQHHLVDGSFRTRWSPFPSWNIFLYKFRSCETSDWRSLQGAH